MILIIAYALCDLFLPSLELLIFLPSTQDCLQATALNNEYLADLNRRVELQTYRADLQDAKEQAEWRGEVWRKAHAARSGQVREFAVWYVITSHQRRACLMWLINELGSEDLRMPLPAMVER